MSAPEDPLARIENALTQLRAGAHPRELPRLVELAKETLAAAREALLARDRELEAVTDPEREAAAEVASLRKELAAARDKIERLRVDLDFARSEHSISEEVHADDRRARKELEQKVKDFDQLLMKDNDAFKRFMDEKLEDGGGGPRKRH